MNILRLSAASGGGFRKAALLAAYLAAGAQATTFDINTNRMDLFNDNRCGLREAIDAINSNSAKWGCPAPNASVSTVNLKEVTYTATVAMTLSRSATLRCPTGTCIVDAGTINGNLFTVSGGALPNVTLYRVTLRQSSGNGNSISGLVVQSGTLTLDQAVITGFKANGLWIKSTGNHSIQRCIFSNNQGSGIRAEATAEFPPPISSCTITGNGYGIRILEGSRVFSESNTIDNNWMGVRVESDLFSDVGSIISNSADAGVSVGTASESAEILLEKTTIRGNRNRGIYVYPISTIKLTGCVIERNKTPGDGAGMYLDGNPNINGNISHAQVYSTTISNNRAGGKGGGMFVAGTSSFNNCTVSHDTAAQGGGSYSITNATNAYHVLNNCTVAFNHATDSGGGVFSEINVGPQVVGIFRSIVAQNTAQKHPDVSGSRNSGLSLFGDLTGSPSNTNISLPTGDITGNPLLGPLTDNAGPIRVKTHGLLPGSPAIDKLDRQGDGTVFTDGRGLPRPSTGKWDMGAYEVMPFETELAEVISSQGWHAPQDDASLSNGAGTVIRSAAIGNYVTYAVAIPDAVNSNGGTKYKIEIGAMASPDGGIVELATSPDSKIYPFTRIGEADLYASTSKPAVLPPNIQTPLTFNFTSPGIKHFRLKITGKNAASLGYFCFFDFIRITKQ